MQLKNDQFQKLLQEREEHSSRNLEKEKFLLRLQKFDVQSQEQGLLDFQAKQESIAQILQQEHEKRLGERSRREEL